MKFLEKDLEEIIFTSDRNQLSKKGLSIYGKMIRQLRIGNYGVADLVTIERPVLPNKNLDDYCRGLITVYELKQEKIGMSAFLQALGYLKGIERYLNKRNFDLEEFDFRIVLIGSKIDTASTFSYLPDYLKLSYDAHQDSSRLSLQCYTYSYSIDGIDFKTQSGYKLIDEGF